MPHIKTIQIICHVRSEKYPKIHIGGGGGYLFVYGLVLSTRLKTHNCILESKGNSSNFEILVKFKDYYNCKVI